MRKPSRKPSIADDFFRDMYLFSEVAKQKSFSRAAAALRVSASLLSRRIAELERGLGLQLLQRTTRSIVLTEAGAFYFKNGQRLVDEARAVHEQVREMAAAPRGLLRVVVAVDLGFNLLAQALALFAERHPEISLDLDVSAGPLDPSRGGFDVALRIGAQPDSSLQARPLKSLYCHVYAAPAYLKRRGTPRHPSALAEHECVRLLDAPQGSSWTFLRGEESVSMDVNGRLAVRSLETIGHLVAQGLGLGLLPEALVREQARSGQLVPLFKTWSAGSLSVVAVTPTPMLSAKTRLFLDFVRIELDRSLY